MIEIIKQLAMDAVDAEMPADLCTGRVISAEPLIIRLERGMELTEPFLILTEAVTETEETGKLRTWSEQEGSRWSHYRILRDRRLKEGEGVVLLRAAGGQQYLVLCRMKKEGRP